MSSGTSEANTFYRLKYSTFPTEAEVRELFKNPYKVCGFISFIYSLKDAYIGSVIDVKRILGNLEYEIIEFADDFAICTDEDIRTKVHDLFVQHMIVMDEIEYE